MRKLIVICLLVFGTLLSCTDQSRAKSWGGTANMELKPGQKLVTATWKNSDLWVLTRPMREGESPETYTFFEESSWDIMEGKVIIKERAR